MSSGHGEALPKLVRSRDKDGILVVGVLPDSDLVRWRADGSERLQFETCKRFHYNERLPSRLLDVRSLASKE